MCRGQKRRRDNAGNFGVVSTALLKYYSYHTEVFYKCLNGCAQCNECAEAKKGAETMPKILVLLALQC